MYDDLLGKDEEEERITIAPPRPQDNIVLKEISKLSKFLLNEFPGEIEGSAVDTAIKLLKYYKQL